jgi:hypothetical protein
MTALDLLTSAYRLANVLSQVEGPDALQGADGLAAYNQMLARLHADGLLRSGSLVSVLDDETNLDLDELGAVRYVLAEWLANAASIALTPDLARGVADARAFIERTALQPRDKSAAHLPMGLANAADFADLDLSA